MGTLDRAAVQSALSGLPGWALGANSIAKTYAHRTFPEAILFVNAVAHLAEAANHHPDVDIRYTKVTLTLTTHDQGGITARDLTLARQIELLAATRSKAPA